jgi:long-chain acyl-CoA synthetase
VATEQVLLARGTGRLVAWLGRQVDCVLTEHELTPAQYRLLSLLEDRPEVASVLADKLTVSRPSVTNVVDGLVARGFVERGSAEGDRRRVTHVLTDDGRRVLHEADRAVEDSLVALLGELEPRGARHATAGLAALSDLYQQRLAAWQPER